MVVQQEEANAIGKKAEGWKGGRAGGRAEGAVSAVKAPSGPGKEAGGFPHLELRAEVSGHTCLMP